MLLKHDHAYASLLPPRCSSISMFHIERLTTTVPADMAAVVNAAVEGGDDAFTSEVVREALREGKFKRGAPGSGNSGASG